MDFEQFMKQAVEMASDILTDTGHMRPTVYVAKDGILTVMLLMVDKPLWRPLIAIAVKKLKADYYAFVDEAYYVAGDENVKGLQVSKNPLKKELLHIFAYSKDGQCKAKVMPFKRIGSKIQLEPNPDFDKADWKDNLIGNIF